MSLKHEGIVELMDLRHTNEKVIVALRKVGCDKDYFGRKLIEEYQDGICTINAELARRKAAAESKQS